MLLYPPWMPSPFFIVFIRILYTSNHEWNKMKIWCGIFIKNNGKSCKLEIKQPIKRVSFTGFSHFLFIARYSNYSSIFEFYIQIAMQTDSSHMKLSNRKHILSDIGVNVLRQIIRSDRHNAIKNKIFILPSNHW